LHLASVLHLYCIRNLNDPLTQEYLFLFFFSVVLVLYHYDQYFHWQVQFDRHSHRGRFVVSFSARGTATAIRGVGHGFFVGVGRAVVLAFEILQNTPGKVGRRGRNNGWWSVWVVQQPCESSHAIVFVLRQCDLCGGWHGTPTGEGVEKHGAAKKKRQVQQSDGR